MLAITSIEAGYDTIVLKGVAPAESLVVVRRENRSIAEEYIDRSGRFVLRFRPPEILAGFTLEARALTGSTQLRQQFDIPVFWGAAPPQRFRRDRRQRTGQQQDTPDGASPQLDGIFAKS